MRRPVTTLLIAAAACAAVPAMAEAAGRGPHGRHDGGSVTVAARAHAGRPAHHRAVPRRHRSPVVRRFPLYSFRPVIFLAPRPVIYAPRPVIYAPRPVIYAPPPVVYAAPPVVYAAPPLPAARAVQTVAAPGRYCREYVTTVTIAGRAEQVYGTACREPDGEWEKTD